jgi:hypothetical protein
MGIRYFDVRLCNTKLGDGFIGPRRSERIAAHAKNIADPTGLNMRACHGPYVFDMTLEQVLVDVAAFLQTTKPSKDETVFTSLSGLLCLGLI